MDQSNKIRLTVAQAVIAFLKQQFVERDGEEQPFFAGCLGIFGHGNVAGIGQALQQDNEFPYIMVRNEQAAVHTAIAYAKMKNRLSTWVCTSSIGPGATNMVTGAACATINRLPVLLLPGDIFARRNVAPVLQQLELSSSQDISVNDAFKPVSRYWDRINRPEQLIMALPEVMRILTSPAETGAVTLSLPQDVQAEAFDFPAALFEKRIWYIPRVRPDQHLLEKAVSKIKVAKKPLIIAGGGVIYSGASKILASFVEQTGIPVAETFAGKGSLPYDHPLNLGAVGATGTKAAVAFAENADLIIGIGTRYSDFTTASKTAFQNPEVEFININLASFDASKQHAMALESDAKACLTEMMPLLDGFQTDEMYRKAAANANFSWILYVKDIYRSSGELPVAQVEVIGAVNKFMKANDVLICAAGSLPGDLHKLWQTVNPGTFHLEYGYSTMGYEIPAGLGVKMAAPDREVLVMVGDGNFLMMNTEIATAIQEGIKFTIVLLNNNGFGSIGALSQSLGSERFGTKYRLKMDGESTSEVVPVDYTLNARSLGANVIGVQTINELEVALVQASLHDKLTVIVIETDLEKGIPSYAWWEVPVAEVSRMDAVKTARENYVNMKNKQRFFL